MTIDDIPAGLPCRATFRVRTLVDTQGLPVNTRNLKPGDRTHGKPGWYTSTGLIKTRDRTRQLVEIEDLSRDKTWIVHYNDVSNLEIISDDNNAG